MNVYTFSVFYLQGVWLWEFGAEIWNPWDGPGKGVGTSNGWMGAGWEWECGMERRRGGWRAVRGRPVTREAGRGVLRAGSGRRGGRREAWRGEGGAAGGGGWRGGRRVARTGRGRERRRGSTGREVVFRGRDYHNLHGIQATDSM
ncbi:hypothetical protein C8J57DRAFT_1245424 [Mycena rebaudengoi]|nr:hypothetical protein C8J57DRAFT_1245424 [Mycena rebaudengoi]